MSDTTISKTQTANRDWYQPGFGRLIAEGRATRKMRVVALARDAGRLNVIAKELGLEPEFTCRSRSIPPSQYC
jgi:hypothetical protein